MDDPLDDLLDTLLVTPPPDFTRRVMAQVHATPRTVPPAPRSRWQWLVLAGGGALAAAQLLAFAFGIWTATAAG